MRREILTIARGVMVMAVAMLLIIVVQLALDLNRAGYPLRSVISFNVLEARQLNSIMKTNLNQLLAVVFTTVAIAVPLTANMYSLKFLEFFIKDPVNATALTLVILADISNAWLAYSLKDNFVPTVTVQVVFALMFLSFALLFPYLYYIFRFLHPRTLLARLEDEIEDGFRAASKHPRHAAETQQQVAEGMEHIANIAIRSIDRMDRSTAIESVLTLGRVAQYYGPAKAVMPQEWFQADPDYFLGFSPAAVEEFTTSRTWVEMKLFSQIYQVMSAAVPRVHDVASTIAKTLHRLGLEKTIYVDAALREIVVEYFNTFLRMAMNRKDTRSAFLLFDEYRTLATEWNAAYPDLVLEVAYYFQYYGEVARDSGIPFLVEAAAHDLGALVQHAWATEAPNRHKLLDRFLEYDHVAPTPMRGVKKAQAILASYFLLAGENEAVEQIRESFADLDPEFIAGLREDLEHIRREKYWEITERRINMDYVPDAQRGKLLQFLDSLVPFAE